MTGFESRRKSKTKTNVPNDDVKGSLRSHLDKCVIKKLPYRELLKQPELVETVTGLKSQRRKRMNKRFVSLSEGVQSLFSFSISYKVGMLPLVSFSNMVQVNAS